MRIAAILRYALFSITLLGLVGCQSGEKTSDSATGSRKSPIQGAGNSDKKLVVGFSQIGAESGWRTANTESIQSEAAKRGIDLKFSDAQQKQENQIRALRNFIAQKVDVIAFAPVKVAGWEPVLREAKEAGIPVIVSDRRPDVPDDLYVTFIGSDFVDEGRRAAEWLATKMNGKAVIAELQGSAGADPAILRKKGFEEGISSHPEMKIVFSQTADFTRAKGKEVTEALLKSPEGKTINALFAHNDDMALGAIQAIEAAGLKPGKDIIIVSIDGIKEALTAITEGKINCVVECNPLLGPIIFDTIDKVVKKEPVDRWIKVEDKLFDESNTGAELPNRKY